MQSLLRSAADVSRRAMAAVPALASQRREKGYMAMANEKIGLGYQNNTWFNHGAATDRRRFRHVRGAVSARRSRADKKYSIGWGPLKHHQFTDVTDMRREIELGVANPHQRMPSVLHANSPDIVGDSFDFKTTLNEASPFSARQKGAVYSADEYAHHWNQEEHKRLRGTDWHKKYYNGSFKLHSL